MDVKVDLEVLAIGSKVYIGGIDDEAGIPALISGICICVDGVQYECVWWDNKNRKSEWIHEREIMKLSESDHRTHIGFIRDVKEEKRAT